MHRAVLQHPQNSILKRQQRPRTSAKAQTYQGPKIPNGRSTEINDIVPENINSPKKDDNDVVDLLACLEKTKVYLAKSQRILNAFKSPTVSEQLRKSCQSHLSNVAGTLQNVSQQLFEYFASSDENVRAENPNDETPQCAGEPGLAMTSSTDVSESSSSRSESSAELPKPSQRKQEQRLETKNGKAAHPPPVSNTRKHERSFPKVRFELPLATKERCPPNYVELNKLRPGHRAPEKHGYLVKNQGAQGLPTPANQKTVKCSAAARSGNDNLPLNRRQKRTSFSDILGTSDDLTRVNKKHNDIYLPFIGEKVPLHHNDLTRAIRLKQDHNMRDLFGL